MTRDTAEPGLGFPVPAPIRSMACSLSEEKGGRLTSGRLHSMKLGQFVVGKSMFGLVLVLMASCSGGGGDVEDVPDPSSLAPELGIFQLASSGNVQGVESLLASDPTLIDIQDEMGRTPLHFAAGNGEEKMVSFLLDKGADPLIQDDNGETPADAARQQGFTGLDKVLTAAAEKAQ